jgi:predicted RND superfamily exporter protein
MIASLEDFVFRHRGAILAAFALVTLAAGHQALQLRLDAGFAKTLPTKHPYVRTFFQYQAELSGANRVIVVLRARNGDMWTPGFLRELEALTRAVLFLPGVDRRTVTSLWTPNTFYFEVTEEGVTADNVVPARILPDRLGPAEVEVVRHNVLRSDLVGRLVAKDHSAAMVMAELVDVDPRSEARLDYLALAERLETDVRGRFENEEFAVHILGFAKLMGDIADGAGSVMRFFGVAFLLTALSVYLYSRSIVLSALLLLCSLVSVVWQFGAIHLLGLGLDPLAILVPFLIFAVGVSHGVQQINLVAQELCRGADSMTAARRSFSGLLVPGSMALLTDVTSYATLTLIAIPMIQELGIVALIGMSFKIATNLFLLPILVSYLRFDAGYAGRIGRAREARLRQLARLGRIAERPVAVAALASFAVLFVVAARESGGRPVGDLQPGSPELRPESRYNLDVDRVVERFDVGLDLLTVIAEVPPAGCVDHSTMQYLSEFSWHMRNVPGVLSVISLPLVARQGNAGWTEGNLKWVDLPRNRYALVKVAGLVPEDSGLVNQDCSVMPIYVFTRDHRAETIQGAIAAVEGFETQNPSDAVRLRLASGNVGVMAATNQELSRAELPMLLYDYAAIIVLVYATFRGWRGTLCCCLPLTLATLLGYWFMKELGIGLKVATMPVMILAMGVGVDYGFYIYNRLQAHCAAGADVATAYQRALLETGNAVIFTAITMAIGVSTWSFSALKFQADMGVLLTFMFLINMFLAVTLMPALAVVLDLVVPRRRPAQAPLGAV